MRAEEEPAMHFKKGVRVVLAKAVGNGLKTGGILLLICLIGGCGGLCRKAETPLAAPALQEIYQAAIEDAAVIEEDERLNLMPVTGERVRVVSWVNAAYIGSYKDKEETDLTWGAVWVTLEPEVKNICRSFEENGLSLRIQQLLGLPPDDTERLFVVLEAAAADLFRPCADPDTASERCARFSDADGFSPEHARFFAGQTADSYRENGYPWTRLGYTYDWNPRTGEYGASEYVIRKGARVRVLGIYSTEEYCGME